MFESFLNSKYVSNLKARRGDITSLFASTLSDIGGSFSDYNAVKGEAEYNKAIYSSNIALNELSMERALEQIEYKKEHMISSQIVSVAKRGAEVAGSPEKVIMDTYHQFELEKLNTEFNYKMVNLENQNRIAAADLNKKLAKISMKNEIVSGTLQGLGQIALMGLGV